MSGGIKTNMKVEIAAFLKNMNALSVMTGKTARQCVLDASVMVVQTGASLQRGSDVIPIAPKKRDVLQMVRRYRHGQEELVKGAKPEAPGDKALWMIRRPSRRRPIAKSGDRRWWTFESAREAREHQPITYRGVGRAGFWAQLPALGRPIPKGVGKMAFLADIPGLKSTSVRLDDPMPAITVTNASVAVQRLAEAKTPYILSKVNNRIAGMAKANKKRLLQFREAGGVVWRQTGSVDSQGFGEYTEDF